ncbi:transcriptional regulator [Enterobacter bugandensis]|nr:transcriptional regulator [Enterobacter bugandensis]
MFKKDVINHFGSNSRVAVVAGVNRSAVSQWKELVPERCAQRLADASCGALRYDQDVYDRHRKSKRRGQKNISIPEKDAD